MFDTLFQAICKVGIFMICAQAIIHFRPQEAYEKYMKLLVSVMILIQLFLPIGSLLFGDGLGRTAERLAAFREELEQELEQAAQEAADADRMLESMTLEEIRERMEEMNSAGEEQGQTGEAVSGRGEEETESGEMAGEDVGAQEPAFRGDSGGEQAEAEPREGIPEVSVGEISVSVE